MTIQKDTTTSELANKKGIKKEAENVDGEEGETSEAPSVSEEDNHVSQNDELENEIEDVVTIDVEADDEVKYYVSPNEIFTIEIHLSNPNQYEIQSFTLNGKKYSNYMFKDGSTMELLLLETTAPSTPRYFEYTIDAIKYIDGTEIKDVAMTGDKTVKTGIEYPSMPSARITSQEISTTYVNLGVEISNPYSLIGKDAVSIYLTDGETMIDTQAFTGGSGSFGQMAVPIAKEFNLNVYLSGNVASKDNFLKLGVSQYFSYEKDDYSKSLKDLDYIIDTLGDKEIEKEVKCLKNGGKLLSLRGIPNKTFAEKNNINCVKKFLFSLSGRKNDNLLKKINGSYEFMFVTSNGNELEKITEIVSKNHVRPLVNERNFKLKDFNEVLNYFLNGKPKGKIVFIND